MLKKPCLTCGKPSIGGRCNTHLAIKQSTSSNYSAEYKRNAYAMRKAFTVGTACVICGKPIMLVTQVSIEHITPRRYGGSDQRTNLGYAHRTCNYAWNKRR